MGLRRSNFKHHLARGEGFHAEQTDLPPIAHCLTYICQNLARYQKGGKVTAGSTAIQTAPVVVCAVSSAIRSNYAILPCIAKCDSYFLRVPCQSATSECSPPFPGSDSALKSVVGVTHGVFHSHFKTHLFPDPFPRNLPLSLTV